MNRQKIIILDFSTESVHIFNVNKNEHEHFFDEEKCRKHGLKESNCQWMFTNDLNIQIH